MGKITLEDMLHDWRETCEDFDVDADTFEGFMEHFELTGEMIVAKTCNWGNRDFFKELDFSFYCGPSIGQGGVTDSLYFPNYLEDLCKELGLKCDLYAAESYHMFLGLETLEEGDEAFEKLMTRIEQDIVIDKEL